MDRYGLFVDAAYLYAAGGQLCYGTKNRAQLKLDFQQAVDDLRSLCSGCCGLKPLRTYWYDAATDAQPTPTHIAVASVEGVQLRLGRLTQGRHGYQNQAPTLVRQADATLVLSKDEVLKFLTLRCPVSGPGVATATAPPPITPPSTT